MAWDRKMQGEFFSRLFPLDSPHLCHIPLAQGQGESLELRSEDIGSSYLGGREPGIQDA